MHSPESRSRRYWALAALFSVMGAVFTFVGAAGCVMSIVLRMDPTKFGFDPLWVDLGRNSIPLFAGIGLLMAGYLFWAGRLKQASFIAIPALAGIVAMFYSM
jgi:hypothetical protein